jgi:hypothetical protein
MAALAALFVVVAVCSFLYFGYYAPRTAHPGPSSRTISEKTHGKQTIKSASPTTPESTEKKERSMGVTATSTATSTATATSSP